MPLPLLVCVHRAAVAYRRSVVVNAAKTVAKDLVREFGAELVSVAGSLLPVVLDHCSRAKESSVWMPCKELAPYLASSVPSARVLDAVLTRARKDAAVAATQHAGCREAAGLSLLSLLHAAVREGNAPPGAPQLSRAQVLPRASEIGAAVFALVTDTSVVRGHCPPDIRTAGIDCHAALRSLDEAAAAAVYAKVEKEHPKALLERLGQP